MKNKLWSVLFSFCSFLSNIHKEGTIKLIGGMNVYKISFHSTITLLLERTNEEKKRKNEFLKNFIRKRMSVFFSSSDACMHDDDNDGNVDNVHLCP